MDDSSPSTFTARPFSTVTHTAHSILPQPRHMVRMRLVVPSLVGTEPELWVSARAGVALAPATTKPAAAARPTNERRDTSVLSDHFNSRSTVIPPSSFPAFTTLPTEARLGAAAQRASTGTPCLARLGAASRIDRNAVPRVPPTLCDCAHITPGAYRPGLGINLGRSKVR